jgi:hypothetical protein
MGGSRWAVRELEDLVAMLGDELGGRHDEKLTVAFRGQLQWPSGSRRCERSQACSTSHT